MKQYHDCLFDICTYPSVPKLICRLSNENTQNARMISPDLQGSAPRDLTGEWNKMYSMDYSKDQHGHILGVSGSGAVLLLIFRCCRSVFHGWKERHDAFRDGSAFLHYERAEV